MYTVKIKDKYFIVEDISTQFSIGSHATINLTINTLKYPDYYHFFTDIFDSYSDEIFNQRPRTDIVFDLQWKNLRGYGCSLKSLDIDSMNYLMYVSIMCDYLEQVTVQEKRDELIDDVLNETSENKNNITKNLN
jgi:hypothetical protein